MTDELVRRHYSEGTARAYLRSVQEFARYFKRPPDQLGPEHIREYVAHLFEVRQLSASSVAQQVAALRFFYVQTFRKGWSVEDTPYPKRPTSLPLILSVEEVARLIDAADTPYHRTLLMAAYGTGARRAEIVNLQIADIDKSMMRITFARARAARTGKYPSAPACTKNCASTTGVSLTSRRFGCFLEVLATPPTTPWTLKSSGTPAGSPRCGPVFANQFTPIP